MPIKLFIQNTARIKCNDFTDQKIKLATLYFRVLFTGLHNTSTGAS